MARQPETAGQDDGYDDITPEDEYGGGVVVIEPSEFDPEDDYDHLADVEGDTEDLTALIEEKCALTTV